MVTLIILIENSYKNWVEKDFFLIIKKYISKKRNSQSQNQLIVEQILHKKRVKFKEKKKL